MHPTAAGGGRIGYMRVGVRVVAGGEKPRLHPAVLTDVLDATGPPAPVHQRRDTQRACLPAPNPDQGAPTGSSILPRARPLALIDSSALVTSSGMTTPRGGEAVFTSLPDAQVHHVFTAVAPSGGCVDNATRTNL
jgi:hypothetical protein